MSKKTWEILVDSSGDRFQFVTDTADSLPTVSGSIVNTGNQRTVRVSFSLCPPDARAIGEMLIAAAKEAKSV